MERTSTAEPPVAAIRRYRPEDHDAVYDICVRTADAGGDARGRYASDDLMPDLFAGPYLHLEPDLAFVLTQHGRVVGYVIGTADTPAFVAGYRREWIPRLAHRYPAPARPPATPDDEMVALHHRPERMLLPELAAYPAHLHIDLLPEQQGRGHGRRLVETFLRAAADAGAAGLHVGMVTANVRARGFYDRLGFHEIAVPDPGPVTYLGRSTGLPSR
ncbi:GNAT family N-acetyltransferase [Micromonospora halophytica]|uniref:Acetyltransferase (GNAT) family protein n=1 Tax=Micromonospora halophytica TaxID=47864 RepID=A0A1C5HU10_9ACTN|nr:GNAT family N-acetyltransferase [Micromonospora halophytica]SCG49500.1 Acetyltransferase (GNAT) family protein [Micromonospora halophytica]